MIEERAWQLLKVKDLIIGTVEGEMEFYECSTNDVLHLRL